MRTRKRLQSQKIIQVPFKVGGIVEPPYFVGREEELNSLVNDAISLAQNNVIIGPRRYGKTSLLHNVKIRVEKSSDLLVAEVNCREMDSIESFYQITIGEILKGYEKVHKVKGILTSFQKIFHEGIVDTLKNIQQIGGSIGKVGEFYLKFREKAMNGKDLARATFEFIANFSEEKKQNMLIIFDEFQKTESFDSFLYELFKSNMDLQKRVRYYFSGSSLRLLGKVFLRPESPLYLMTNKHFMKPLGEKTVSQYIRDRLKTAGIRINAEVANSFYMLTGGIPFYVQKLGLLCFQQLFLERCKIITKEVVEKNFWAMLEEFDSEFESRLMSRFSDQQRRIIKVIATFSGIRLSDIARKLGNKTTDISSQVHRLVEAMILYKDENNFYRLSDEVFKRWLVKPKPL
jgi:AAA+ ATPase superfamily predicted ATPase